MPSITLQQGTISYTDTGAGEPVVLLHGVLVDATFWRKVTPQLDGLRVIAPTLPLGSHTSPVTDRGKLSPPDIAQLVADFMAALELDGVTIVGCDTGGAIAQLVATRHPERLKRLVLLPCDAFENFLPKLFKPLQLSAKAPAIAFAALQPLRLRPFRRLPIAFGFLTKRPVEPRAVEDAWIRPFFTDKAIRGDTFAVLRGIDKRYTVEAAQALERFEKPTLVAWATEDRVFPFAHAERLAALIPGARLERIDDSYSFTPEDQPERTAQLIREFVAATP